MTKFQRILAILLAAQALLAAAAWYPTDALSWSSNRVENEIAQNGYSSFFRAAATNEIDYHAYYASRDPASNLKLLAEALEAGGGQLTRLDEGRLDLQHPRDGRRHVLGGIGQAGRGAGAPESAHSFW